MINLVRTIQKTNENKNEIRKLMNQFVDKIHTLKVNFYGYNFEQKLLLEEDYGLELQPNPEVIQKKNELKKKEGILEDLKNSGIQMKIITNLL